LYNHNDDVGKDADEIVKINWADKWWNGWVITVDI
jgi:hypothetical protein